MALFNKAQPRNGNGDQAAPVTPQLARSRLQEMLDTVNAIRKHGNHFANLAASLVHDAERGVRYYDRLGVDLTQCLTDAGAEPEQTTDEEMVAYIPKAYQPPVDDNAQS